MPLLVQMPAAVRFVSYEPALGPVDFEPWLQGVDWLICGGESGTHLGDHPRRRMAMSWALDVKEQCVKHGVAFFMKQQSGLRTEYKPWIEEPDGSRWKWAQYPGKLMPPEKLP